mmetsp:Transcript_3423/g.9551  ORF Transcript_3423/g.9551 Transcript_3423/m.9551 type:complete len:216 (-) Transcript_3423:2155-2802(-)
MGCEQGRRRFACTVCVRQPGIGTPNGASTTMSHHMCSPSCSPSSSGGSSCRLCLAACLRLRLPRNEYANAGQLLFKRRAAVDKAGGRRAAAATRQPVVGDIAERFCQHGTRSGLALTCAAGCTTTSHPFGAAAAVVAVAPAAAAAADAATATIAAIVTAAAGRVAAVVAAATAVTSAGAVCATTAAIVSVRQHQRVGHLLDKYAGAARPLNGLPQ